MKDLKCGLTDCKFNCGYCCCSNEITVSGNTDCKTYSPNKRKNAFESGEDFVKANYAVDTAVACYADCVFNKNGRCVSSGITVTSEGNSVASCLTFVKK